MDKVRSTLGKKAPTPDELLDLREKREIAAEFVAREHSMHPEEVVFECDSCKAVETCPYAFDPYNVDWNGSGDCLGSK